VSGADLAKKKRVDSEGMKLWKHLVLHVFVLNPVEWVCAFKTSIDEQ